MLARGKRSSRGLDVSPRVAGAELWSIHAHEGTEAHVLVVAERVEPRHRGLERNADVEADVVRSALRLVHVLGAGVVLREPHAHVLVGKVAGVVDSIVAVSHGFGEDLSALGERAHGVHVRADAVGELAAGDVIRTLRRVVLNAAEDDGLGGTVVRHVVERAAARGVGVARVCQGLVARLRAILHLADYALIDAVSTGRVHRVVRGAGLTIGAAASDPTITVYRLLSGRGGTLEEVELGALACAEAGDDGQRPALVGVCQVRKGARDQIEKASASYGRSVVAPNVYMNPSAKPIWRHATPAALSLSQYLCSTAAVSKMQGANRPTGCCGAPVAAHGSPRALPVAIRVTRARVVHFEAAHSAAGSRVRGERLRFGAALRLRHAGQARLELADGARRNALDGALALASDGHRDVVHVG